MSYKLIAAAAGVLLLAAAAGAGLAHAKDGDRGQGGAVRQAPQRSAPQRSAPRAERSRPQAQPRAQRAPERRAAQRRQAQPKAQRAQRSQQQQQQRVERRQRDQKQSVKRQQREQTQRAERQREQQKQAAPKQTDRPANQQAERSGPQQVNQLQATNEQRKGVRERILRERGVDRITKKDFRERVAVGVRIDRRHHRHLHRLTPAILAFAPIYAGYSYLVVDDDICIVDPATYYVVDVIPSSVEYAAGSSRPQLVLSAEDMRFIYASVPKDRPVDVRIRLALGAEIPRPIDLERFPGGVIDRVPQMEGYRYIVVEADVVIVDPNDRSVALVITE